LLRRCRTWSRAVGDRRHTDRGIATMSDTMTSVGRRLAVPIFPTLDGTELDLQMLRGKKVLLFMWGSW
jgi:hypothetical protein